MGEVRAQVRDTSSLESGSPDHVARVPGDRSEPLTKEQGFVVILRRSAKQLQVAADRSILETLEDHGIEVPFCCREGLCRTCETPLCAGLADHRDHVLSDEERASQRSIIICVSRAQTPALELDL